MSILHSRVVRHCSDLHIPLQIESVTLSEYKAIKKHLIIKSIWNAFLNLHQLSIKNSAFYRLTPLMKTEQ